MSEQSSPPPAPERPPPAQEPPNKLHEWAAAVAIMMFLSLIVYVFWSMLRSARL